MSKERVIMNGCTAVTHVSYALSDAVVIFPISPASDMGELADVWSASEKENLMGQPVVVKEMESEAGAAGAVHGCLSGGALTSTYTASQGLMLMIPNMYKIAGELLPAVFHVTARSLSSHALSIFGDHQDVMACRQTGFCFLCSSSVQESMDLSLVAHLSAIDGSLPFVHFFDGWRTSSEMHSIEAIDYESIRGLVDWGKVQEFRARAMNSEHPEIRGTAQNPDVYFQNREAINPYYEAMPNVVKRNLERVANLTGRKHQLFDYVGASDAEYVIVAMGSACEAIEETIEHLNADGWKVGLVKVRLFRPFSSKDMADAIPQSVKRIGTLDRTKESGAPGEPLYLDVIAALRQQNRDIEVIGGRYGLSSKEFNPTMVKAVYENLKSDKPKNSFSVGITDDVSHLSLPLPDTYITTPKDILQCKFYGFGSDGTVSANKQAAQIVGTHTDLEVQAYFSYDSKKSGGYTVSNLRFARSPIKSTYLINEADYVACHKDSYVRSFNVLEDIKENGIFVLNSSWTVAEMEQELPAALRRIIAQKHVQFYNIDATAIAKEQNLGSRINLIMETVFFKLTSLLPFADAVTYLKQEAAKSYIRQGITVIEQNNKGIDATEAALIKVDYPMSWAEAKDAESSVSIVPEFISKVARPILALEGDNLPVSLFDASGRVPCGTTAFEKRAVAIDVPEWLVDKCIECCQCSLVCPHAAIRPYLPTDDELKGAPAGYDNKKAVGMGSEKTLNFRIEVYAEDCQGCGSCAEVCPAQALVMKPLSERIEQQRVTVAFSESHVTEKSGLQPVNTIRGSQLKQPLFEFSGACAGCGETPYVKLVTQLFGERMVIANATGCSSIYGASMPSMPYTKNKLGCGPAWGNSLFEDAGEYGYGIATALKQRRERLELLVQQAISDKGTPEPTRNLLQNWDAVKDDGEKSYQAGLALKQDFVNWQGDILTELKQSADLFGKKSVWVIGGDGWAYDIGFGGLDHVLASGENINVLVLDSECYSNTGGQTSKATAMGAVAKFSSLGKRTNRKELGRMFMTYDNIYVASIAMGADKQQAITALCEAEAYDGPSIVIAYCPCINWGLRQGQGSSMSEEKRAVASGYWPLYRFNPMLRENGKSGLSIDSEKASLDLNLFMDAEDRFASLMEQHPNIAKSLRKALDNRCNIVYDDLKREL